MASFNSNTNCTNNRPSRRTFSSPYLSTLHSSRAQRLRSCANPRPRPRFAPSSPNEHRRGYNERDPNIAPRGSRSAPPYLYSFQPENQSYHQMSEEFRSQIDKSLLKSKLDRLKVFQERLENEIKDLEGSCGDSGIDPYFSYSASSQSKNEECSNVSSTKPKLKHFRVLGGGPEHLCYKLHRKPDSEGKVRSFSIEVDVKGFAAENIAIDSEDTIMVVKATKINRVKRHLKIVAPTTKDMEKAYVHPPRLGVLVIDFN